jgi:hypothetical protein
MPITINPTRDTPVWNINSGTGVGSDDIPLEATPVDFNPTLGDSLLFATDVETCTLTPVFGGANDGCYYQPFVDGDAISIQYQLNVLNSTLVTDAVRQAEAGGDFWDIIGGYTSGYDFVQSIYDTVSLYDDCTCEAFDLDGCKPLEIFFGVYLDEEQSRKLGWQGYDANGVNTDINRSVFMAYVWIKIFTSSGFPYTWHFRGPNPAGGIFRTQSYQRAKCEHTFMIQSDFTDFDLFGVYYGLPYRYYGWLEPDPYIPARGCYSQVPWNGLCGDARTRLPYFNNIQRFSGYSEIADYTTEQLNWNRHNGATRGKLDTNYSVRTVPIPQWLAEHIANHNQGRKTWLNGHNVTATSPVSKNNDKGQYFISSLDYRKENETNEFCKKCK